METKDNSHFDKIFWFCCIAFFLGLVFLSALIWLPVPHENQSMANIAIGFLTGTVIVVPLSFLLGGNIPQQKKSDTVPGTTTVELSATSTSGKIDDTQANITQAK